MKILVAQDEAFNFTYRANIDWLKRHAYVRFFSPCGSTPCPSLLRSGVECIVDDERLGNDDEWLDNITVVNLLRTGDVDLLYLPGGYPELFAKQLEENAPMRRAIKEFAEQGGRIFAECGGFMYLCTCIDDADMCGVLPIQATMEGARLHLGYRQMEWGGKLIKGHEFHYSSIQDIDALILKGEDGRVNPSVEVIRAQCNASGKPVDTPIYKYKNVVAGYTHWYWADWEMDDLTSFWK